MVSRGCDSCGACCCCAPPVWAITVLPRSDATDPFCLRFVLERSGLPVAQIMPNWSVLAGTRVDYCLQIGREFAQQCRGNTSQGRVLVGLFVFGLEGFDSRRLHQEQVAFGESFR